MHVTKLLLKWVLKIIPPTKNIILQNQLKDTIPRTSFYNIKNYTR
jgi:hypothetical protein